MTHHTKIAITGPGRGIVHIDGEELRGITGLTFTSSANDLSRLELRLQMPTADIEGDMVVTVPPATHASLVALGWTPPA